MEEASNWEAFDIVKFITKQTGRSIRFKDAKYLASFSFPLEQKLRVIQHVIDLGRAETIYSALYFRIAFQEAEVAFHKGPVPEKKSRFVPIRDVIFP